MHCYHLLTFSDTMFVGLLTDEPLLCVLFSFPFTFCRKVSATPSRSLFHLWQRSTHNMSQQRTPYFTVLSIWAEAFHMKTLTVNTTAKATTWIQKWCDERQWMLRMEAAGVLTAAEWARVRENTDKPESSCLLEVLCYRCFERVKTLLFTVAFAFMFSFNALVWHVSTTVV